MFAPKTTCQLRMVNATGGQKYALLLAGTRLANNERSGSAKERF
jgi:hypothetical protein